MADRDHRPQRGARPTGGSPAKSSGKRATRAPDARAHSTCANLFRILSPQPALNPGREVRGKRNRPRDCPSSTAHVSPPSLGTGTTTTPRRSSGARLSQDQVEVRKHTAFISAGRNVRVSGLRGASEELTWAWGAERGWGSGHTEPGAPPGPGPLKTQHSRRTTWSLPPRPQAQRGAGRWCALFSGRRRYGLCSSRFVWDLEAHSDPQQARRAFHSHLRSAAPPGTGTAHAQRPGGRCPRHMAGCL